MVDDGAPGVARNVEDAHLGPQGREALGQLAAAHAGHHHVGEQQMDLGLVLLADEEGLAAVLRVEDVVAFVLGGEFFKRTLCEIGFTHVLPLAVKPGKTG